MLIEIASNLPAHTTIDNDRVMVIIKYTELPYLVNILVIIDLFMYYRCRPMMMDDILATIVHGRQVICPN